MHRLLTHSASQRFLCEKEVLCYSGSVVIIYENFFRDSNIHYSSELTHPSQIHPGQNVSESQLTERAGATAAGPAKYGLLAALGALRPRIKVPGGADHLSGCAVRTGCWWLWQLGEFLGVAVKIYRWLQQWKFCFSRQPLDTQGHIPNTLS